MLLKTIESKLIKEGFDFRTVKSTENTDFIFIDIRFEKFERHSNLLKYAKRYNIPYEFRANYESLLLKLQ